jgi:hypothetical protein
VNCFDDIPEDDIESYPCECGGNITKKDNGDFECDKCDFTAQKQAKDEVKG